ncbi:anion permease [Oligoflexia bacterium]|nr:anion permease [Oligoflexia bacterium]
MFPLPLAGGAYLGWALGANDSANVFGTAVAARIISFRKASLLCAIAVILGAYFQGEAGLHTYRELADQNLQTILVTAVAAAFTVTIMTFFRLPISTSQAVVGAIAGIGLATKTMHWAGLQKVVICWIVTPVGAMFFSCILYFLLSALMARIPMSILTRDKILWSGLLLVGIYGAYALGANNVANATGIFSGQFTAQGYTDSHLTLIGGIAIAFGSITYSKRVMLAVGSGIMPLDAFTGLVAVAAMAVTVHIFAVIGVPVSTSQGVVGAIFGIGLIRGVNTVNYRTLRIICIGWVLTPALALVLSAAGFAIFCS